MSRARIRNISQKSFGNLMIFTIILLSLLGLIKSQTVSVTPTVTTVSAVTSYEFLIQQIAT